mmetsp:Transcript_25813/g.51413  ORF Transcript_25813/g.51413 Transcript_25813/m.51413 type:complete len:99 (-) Transcript_25813:38-334(-)
MMGALHRNPDLASEVELQGVTDFEHHEQGKTERAIRSVGMSTAGAEGDGNDVHVCGGGPPSHPDAVLAAGPHCSASRCVLLVCQTLRKKRNSRPTGKF